MVLFGQNTLWRGQTLRCYMMLGTVASNRGRIIQTVISIERFNVIVEYLWLLIKRFEIDWVKVTLSSCSSANLSFIILFSLSASITFIDRLIFISSIWTLYTWLSSQSPLHGLALCTRVLIWHHMRIKDVEMLRLSVCICHISQRNSIMNRTISFHKSIRLLRVNSANKFVHKLLFIVDLGVIYDFG